MITHIASGTSSNAMVGQISIISSKADVKKANRKVSR